MALHASLAALLVGGSLLIGMTGYRFLEQLDWLDAFLNASMILGGMGPMTNPQTAGVMIGVLFAPVLHRARHLFHWRKDMKK